MRNMIFDDRNLVTKEKYRCKLGNRKMQVVVVIKTMKKLGLFANSVMHACSID